MASGPTFHPAAAFQPASQPDTSSRKASFSEEPEGQATYGTANLRPEKTGLPFIVFISQRDGAQHAVRVKDGRAPRLRAAEMGTYAISPVEWKAGLRLTSQEENLLDGWIERNRKVLVDYWNGVIEYTDEAIDQLSKIR